MICCHGITRPHNFGGRIQGYWDPGRSLSVVTYVGVPVEENFLDILMNTRISVINLECDYEEACINSL